MTVYSTCIYWPHFPHRFIPFIKALVTKACAIPIEAETYFFFLKICWITPPALIRVRYGREGCIKSVPRCTDENWRILPSWSTNHMSHFSHSFIVPQGRHLIEREEVSNNAFALSGPTLPLSRLSRSFIRALAWIVFCSRCLKFNRQAAIQKAVWNTLCMTQHFFSSETPLPHKHKVFYL